MTTVNMLHYQQEYPQKYTNIPIQRQNEPIQPKAGYERTPNADKFAKQNPKRKWYKDPFVCLAIAVPLSMVLIDGIFLKGKHMKSIFNHNKPITKEEKKLFETAKENLKQTEQKVSQYETEMDEIKAFMNEQKKKAEEILKDRNEVKDGTVTYTKGLFQDTIIDNSPNGFKLYVLSPLAPHKNSGSLGGEYRLERMINGKLKERIILQKTLSLEMGDKFARTIYDESGKKLVEHGNAAAGSVIAELEAGKLVRQYEKSITELLGKPTTKYKEMNGKDNITHSVEKNETTITIDGKSYDSRSLGSKLWNWFGETVSDAI